MSLWEVIDTQDEETKQMGNDESLSSLWEVIKLAYFEPLQQEALKSSPQIRSCISYGFISLSLGSSVFIFGEGSSLIAHISLESDVDILIWLPGGNFILIGDSAGKIHCLHIESKQIIFTKKISLSEGMNCVFISGKSFLTNNGALVILITSSGKIFELSSIDVEALEEGLKAKDLPYLRSLQSSFSLSCYSVQLSSEVLCADCLLYDTSKICVWIGTKDGLYWWTSDSIISSDSTFTQFSDICCTSVVYLFNGRYLAVIDDRNHLRILSGSSGIIVWDSDTEDKIQSSIIHMQKLTMDCFSTQLLLLLKMNEESSYYIMNVPSFECCSVISVSKDTMPLILGNEADSIIYLEPEFSDDSSTLRGLKMKSIFDGLPETRLVKLLKKHKYDEAEELCILFSQLDVNEVLKAKSNHICDLLNPWQTPSANSTMRDLAETPRQLEDLFLTLDRIDDHEFVTVLCINAPMIDVQSTCQLLTYAKKRLAMAIQGGEGDDMSSLMQRVSKTLYCLNTFCSIYTSPDIHDWFSFSRSSMLEEFMDHLKRGNLDVAATIWHRHQYEFLSDVDDICVARILDSVPFNISSKKLCTWMPKHLLKDLIKLCPSAIELIAKWADDRIKNLEIVEKENWPVNGYDLATVTIEVIENIAADFYTGGNIEIQLAVHMAQWKAHCPSSCLYHLRQTALALKDLQFLAQEFYIKIKFSEYIQEDKSAVIFALLDWLVSGDEVEPLVKGFINSFIRRHELNMDEVLLSYVLNCLALSDCSWWMHEEAPWEDKVYAVINIISDAQMKAKCIVECIRMAPVPWSQGTYKMCKIGMALNTPYVIDLQEQERLAKLKIVLRRYNLHLINYGDDCNSQFILRSIVNREGETVMEDALSVVSALKSVKTCDAYYFRILYLLKRELYSEAKSVLSCLGPDDEIVVCQKLIIHLVQQCTVTPFTKNCRHNLENICSSILILEPILEKNVKMQYSNLDAIFTKIRRINNLQRKYDLYPTLDDLDNEEYCLNFLKSFLNDLYEKTREQIHISPQLMNRTSVVTTNNITLGTETRRSTIFGKIPNGLGAEGRRTSIFVTQNSMGAAQNNTLVSDSKRTSIFNPQKTLAHETTNFTTEDANVSNSDEEFYCKHSNTLEHLSRLLGIQRQRMLTVLAFMANQRGSLAAALDFTRQLSEETDYLYLPDVVFELIKTITKVPQSTAITQSPGKQHLSIEFTESILAAISSSLLHCSPRYIYSLNEYGTLYQLSKILYEECHSKGVYVSSDNSSKSVDYLHHRLFLQVYIHSGMPIEENIVTDSLTNILQSLSRVKSRLGYSNTLPQECDIYSTDIYIEGEKTDALPELIQHLHERSQDLIALFVSQNISFAPGQPDDIPQFNVVLKNERVLTLLMKMINSRQKDLPFATALLTLLTGKEVFRILSDIIKRLGYDYHRLLLVGEIGCEYCIMNRFPEITNQFSVLAKRATWGITLEHLGISFNSGFSGDRSALQGVLNELIAHSECTYALLDQFCIDFSWNLNEVLLSYLRETIRKWKPLCVDHVEAVPHFQDAPASLIRKIEMIIAKIDNKPEVRKVLKDELHRTSSYDYEILDVLFNFMSIFDMDDMKDIERGKDVLQFLKNYQRQCEPLDYEKNEWVAKHPASRDIPPIAKFRLPFHQLYDVEKKTSSKEKDEKKKSASKEIIEREFNRNTVEKWIHLAYTLKVTSDQFYFLATQNTLKKALEKEKRSQEWQVCSVNGNLLSQIQFMISNIKHPQLATACAHLVVTSLHPGADKVDAAKKCIFLVEKFAEKENVRQQFETRYQLLAVEHALHKFGLATPQCLNLISKPSALIDALYENPSLSSIVTLNTEHLLDINGCVSEICRVMNFNLVSIQMDLLSRWLPMETFSMQDNDETVSNFKLNLVQDVQEDGAGSTDSTLSRTIYLLRCCPQDEAVSYLLQQALSNDDNVGCSVRLKALRCLLAIADEETIQKLCCMSMNDVRELLQTLTYVNRLEALGHAISYKTFSKMDKHALVEGIWRAQRHNSEALLLLVDICHDYKITTASLWEAVLAQLRNLVEIGKIEVNALEKVLMQIRNIPHLWVLSQTTSAWTFLIYNPFKKAHFPLSDSDLRSCVHAINLLLQSCPVDICVEDLLHMCISFNLPILALSTTAKSDLKYQHIQTILEKYSVEELNADYEKVKTMLALPQNIEDLLASCGK